MEVERKLFQTKIEYSFPLLKWIRMIKLQE